MPSDWSITRTKAITTRGRLVPLPVVLCGIYGAVDQSWPFKHASLMENFHYQPGNYEGLNQCWFAVGPPSSTLAQHKISIGSMSRVFREWFCILPNKSYVTLSWLAIGADCYFPENTVLETYLIRGVFHVTWCYWPIRSRSFRRACWRKRHFSRKFCEPQWRHWKPFWMATRWK